MKGASQANPPIISLGVPYKKTHPIWQRNTLHLLWPIHSEVSNAWTHQEIEERTAMRTWSFGGHRAPSSQSRLQVEGCSPGSLGIQDSTGHPGNPSIHFRTRSLRMIRATLSAVEPSGCFQKRLAGCSSMCPLQELSCIIPGLQAQT